MIQVEVPIRDGKVKTEYIIEYGKDDISYHPYDIDTCRGRRGVEYINMLNAFDIETSTIQIGEKHEGFMYLWQFCLDNGQVIMGRTWSEFLEFCGKLSNIYELHKRKRLVIYVHNLAYEFQFISRFFEWEKVFAVGSRKVVNAVTTTGLEFRCSYKLTNMSLEKWTQQSKHCIHVKLADSVDYHVLRTPSTQLDSNMLAYGYSDVKGVTESLLDYLEDDTLGTIPMTSTGFVRRECREAVKKNPRNRYKMLDAKLNVDVYKMCKEALRGGNTHGSRFFVGKIVKDVDSYDVASSYPYVQMTKYFPMSPFKKAIFKKGEDLDDLCRRYCVLFRVAFLGLKLKSGVPIPYLSSSKMLDNRKMRCFNGRVLSADYCYMTITEIDYKIIKQQYTWDEQYVGDVYIAARGKLPKELRDEIRHFFQQKCELKTGDPYYYMKSKNRLNGIFGMTCTDIVRDDWIYDDGEWRCEKADISEALESYYKSRNSFLFYQHGLYTTAHARAHLQRLIDVIGSRTIYVDTDSDKCYHPDHAAIERLNASIRIEAENAGAYADVDGKRYYMGVYEKEKPYDRFITLGAKKYAYEQNGKLCVTVSGVNKKLGGKELGKIENFKNGFVFREAGGQTLWYNDDPIHILDVNGEKILTAANVGMEDSTYTLGVTKEFQEIMGMYIDNFEI